MKIYKTEQGSLTDSQVEEITALLKEGALIAFPTETVYGIGCLPDQEETFKKIYELKGRDFDKPLSLHIGDKSVVPSYVSELPDFYESFTNEFWPGPVTLILNDKEGKTVGFRYPSNKAILQVLEGSGNILFGTSANKSGGPSPVAAEDTLSQLGTSIDILIDDGETELAKDSTIVIDKNGSPEILREGCYFDKVKQFIEALMQKNG